MDAAHEIYMPGEPLLDNGLVDHHNLQAKEKKNTSQIGGQASVGLCCKYRCHGRVPIPGDARIASVKVFRPRDNRPPDTGKENITDWN